MTTTMTLRFLFLLSTLLLSLTTAKSNLRITKKYLRCNTSTYGCGSDRVQMCHFNGKEFQTLCVRSRSSIVEHLHPQDYCGQCVETSRTAFQTKKELQSAVDRYLDDTTSHKELAAQYGYPMGQWDISQVTDLSHLFAKRVEFNEDLGDWNTSQVTDMSFLFWHAHAFRGTGMEHWDVRKVQSMERMFFGAESFDSDISQWQTSSLTNLMGTFWRAVSFNAPIGSWDTSHVIITSRCFSDAIAFNQPLDQWDTSNVQDMSFMFLQATVFQQDLTQWQVHNVNTFERMFAKAPYFQSNAVETALLQSWHMHQGATVTHMFTAPRDKSLRAQQLESLQMDVQSLLHATTRQHNTTQPTTTDEPIDDMALSREIRCHGGVCM